MQRGSAERLLVHRLHESLRRAPGGGGGRGSARPFSGERESGRSRQSTIAATSRAPSCTRPSPATSPRARCSDVARGNVRHHGSLLAIGGRCMGRPRPCTGPDGSPWRNAMRSKYRDQSTAGIDQHPNLPSIAFAVIAGSPRRSSTLVLTCPGRGGTRRGRRCRHVRPGGKDRIRNRVAAPNYLKPPACRASNEDGLAPSWQAAYTPKGVQVPRSGMPELSPTQSEAERSGACVNPWKPSSERGCATPGRGGASRTR